MRLAAVTATTPARATAAGITVTTATATTGITESRQLLSPNAVSEYLTA